MVPLYILRVFPSRLLVFQVSEAQDVFPNISKDVLSPDFKIIKPFVWDGAIIRKPHFVSVKAVLQTLLYCHLAKTLGFHISMSHEV